MMGAAVISLSGYHQSFMVLRLKLLGSPGLEREGVPLTGRSTQRRRLALLALLALARPRGLTRDKLIAFLWPERDADAGRHSLSQTLYAIRQDLVADLLTPGVDDVRLNPAAIWCDVWLFEDACAGGDGELERAVALYGGPFLDGFYVNDAPEFERWSEGERQRLGRAYADALERLARIAAQGGSPIRAAEWWERRAALDPLDSRVAVALMNALAAGGNRAGALRHAKFHASLLEQELGVGPNPAVAAVAQRLARESGLPAEQSPPTPAEQRELSRRRLSAALGERYRVEGELGSGGMATVFLAEDLQLGRRVAVKVLKPEVSTDSGSERFLREIGIAARLEHPHILPLFDSGRLGAEGGATSGLYYVTPYVPGGSLRHRLRREHQLPVEEAVRITCEIAAALGHAHGHGIIHRDIKPENVLLQEGSVLVADFGLARALDAAAGERLTQTGVAVGTPHYMSPEQGGASADLDGRSDIYALGCVLYEMLAGEPPFGGPTAQAILARHAVDPVPPLRTIRATVPPQIEGTVLKALAKVPADRFSTAAQFAEALTRPDAAVIGSSRPSRQAHWGRAAAALALLAAGSAGGWLALRPAGPRVVPSAAVVAVLPFVPSARDTLLSRLGQDLALTISADLDGVGEVRAVDPRTLLAQARGSAASLSLHDGAALGRRLGAGSVLYGTLVREGPKVRLDLGLFGSDSSPSDSVIALTRLTVSGSPDSMGGLTDSVARLLLRQIWRRGEAPSPSLDAALRTRSGPALRAFLAGERQLVANRWKEAADAYRQAVDADSTFWLAYWRQGFVHYWLSRGQTDSALARIYWNHRAELPPWERLLIESLAAESLSTRLELLRKATELSPDSWPAWLLYGDALIHGGSLLGHTREEARKAFSRATTFNPGLIPAWDHGTWLAIQDGDTLWSGNALRALAELEAGPALYEEYEQDELRQLRLLDRVRRGDSLAARLIADSVAEEGLSMTPAIPYWYGFYAMQIRLSRAMLRRVADDEGVPFHLGMVAYSFAGRGAWDSAMTAMERYVESGTNPNAPLLWYQVATLGAWVGALDPDLAASRRSGAARAAAEGDGTAKAQLHWLDGVLAAARRNPPDLTAARTALRALKDPGTANAERSLEAFELALSDRQHDAGSRLAALEWARAERPGKGETDLRALTAVNRLAAADWLVASGDTIQAARLLRWHEAYAGSLWTGMLMPQAYLRRARIEERQGRLTVAERYYREFLLQCDLPVARQQHLIREAALALARVRGAAAAMADSR